VGIVTTHRPGGARKRGLSKQHADGWEIAVVDELGVGRDQAFDRPVARVLIAGPHSNASVRETRIRPRVNDVASPDPKSARSETVTGMSGFVHRGFESLPLRFRPLPSPKPSSAAAS